MTEVIIPVSSFSRKIIETEHGTTSPLTLQSRDLLYKQLCYDSAEPRSSFGTARKILNDAITLKVSDKLAKQIKRKGPRIGMILYAVHVDMMCRYALAQMKVGVGKTEAINNFYFDYDIDDEDFAFPSAYKRLQRAEWTLEEKNPIFCRKTTSRKVLEIPTRKEAIVTAHIPLDADGAHHARNRFVYLFYRLRHNTSEHIIKCFPMWLDFHFRQFSAKETADAWDLPLSTTYDRIAAMRDALSVDDDFYALTLSILKDCYASGQVEVLPV